MAEELKDTKLNLDDISKLLDKKNISFPSNKIKRIIQLSDEDIGKQTSITPTVVSHAILMFISKLVLESCEIVKEENHTKNNKLDLNILNKCIERVEEFDFLIEADEEQEDGGEVSEEPENFTSDEVKQEE